MAKVLVAEDDIFLSSLLVRDLVAEKFEARAAYDGLQALEEIRTWQPDIVLLDLLMPNKDGFEVLADTRADPVIAKTRIVILSNLSDADTIERIKKLEIEEYLIKADTTPHEVVDRVQHLLAG